MEKKETNVVAADDDASPFFLVEVTGDSEVDCESRSEISASMDEDDAESCCCGPLGDDLSNFDVKAAAEEREVRIKSWLQYEQEPKSRVSADSAANEFMNEMEKSKLFWETCLAS